MLAWTSDTTSLKDPLNHAASAIGTFAFEARVPVRDCDYFRGPGPLAIRPRPPPPPHLPTANGTGLLPQLASH